MKIKPNVNVKNHKKLVLKPQAVHTIYRPHK